MTTCAVPVGLCIRDKRREAIFGAINTWQRAHGPARILAHCDVRWAIQEYRRRHLIPEQLAFEATVRRSKAR